MIIEWWIKGILSGELNLRTKITAWHLGRKLRSFLKEEKMESKRWFQSKTLWTNTLIGIAGVIVSLTQDGGLNPKAVGILTTVGGVVNIILRIITDKPIDKP